MSTSAIRTQAALDQVGWARLIPGCKASKPALRKRPQSVRNNGGLHAVEEPLPDGRRMAADAIMSFVLPCPLASEQLSRLWTLVLSDYALILTSWTCVTGLMTAFRHGFGSLPTWTLPPWEAALETLGNGLLFSVITTLLGYSEGLYQRGLEFRSRFGLITKSVIWSTILLSAAMWLYGASPSLGQFTSSASLSLAMLLGSRKWRDRAIARSHSQHARNVLIVGAGAVGRAVADYLDRHPERQRIVRGFLDETRTPTFRLLGPPEQLAAVARAEFIDEVIVATPNRTDLTQYVIREARRNHLDVKVVPDFYGCQVQPPQIENMGAVSLISLHRERLPVFGLLIKRALDAVLSSLLLLVSFPLLLTIAGIIKIDSEGPVLYGALRIGRKGRKFHCYKFRTMVANAAESKDQLRGKNQRQGPCFKIANDPRITRVGRCLRRYSLDELPQLWNVLKGDMSLVGPRPHPLDDFARYELPHFRRLDVTPGITGLWQVTARQVASFQATMSLDLEYIERWSLWLDLRILLKTFMVVLRGTGV